MSLRVASSYSRAVTGRTILREADYHAAYKAYGAESSRSAAKRDYQTADEIKDHMLKLKETDARRRRAAEKQRQENEREHLSAASAVERKRFDQTWADETARVDAKCADHMAVLAEVQQIKREDFGKAEAERLGKLRFRKSTKLIDLEVNEERMQKARHFKEAADMAQRHAALLKAEMAAFEERRRRMCAKPRADFAELLAAERRNAEQYCHGLRVDLRRRRAAALSELAQRYKNLAVDLEHSLAIEYHLPAEVGFVRTHRSRAQHSSTFRGSLKLESLKGTKFDVRVV